MTKAPTPTEKSKKQCDNTKTPPKTSITQRLRTDSCKIFSQVARGIHEHVFLVSYLLFYNKSETYCSTSLDISMTMLK